ncbi:hypothetical protein [Murimonas intestini]|uniref:hypothetical protein n=1 Tax=Murimonas intestini TaxID=1337051 RepID=UPI00214C1F0B|nr:hypothetical protein [Murimonas intestini]MCR1841107.1 hypothetical protein [Murimonas intestini]
MRKKRSKSNQALHKYGGAVNTPDRKVWSLPFQFNLFERRAEIRISGGYIK